MSPVRRDELGAGYASQLVACVVLVIGVAVSMGIYIARLNAHLDEQRDLSSVYLPDCPDGRGGFMVYPDERRSGDQCYTAGEDESMDVDEAQRLSGSNLAQGFDYLLPATSVGASLLAKNVNDNACFLNERGACEFFASKLAPTSLLLWPAAAWLFRFHGRSRMNTPTANLVSPPRLRTTD